MKKALAVASLFAIIGPLVTTQYAVAATKKTHKAKHRHVRSYKDEAPMAIANAKDAPVEAPKETSWLDNVSGYVTLTSNYLFRGISQSRNLPATQGSLTYSFPVGFYLNMWGSSVRFDSTPNAHSEIDTVGGYHNTIGENFTYDLNLARYNYPGARLSNYNEFNSLFNYYFLQAQYSYTANAYGTHTIGRYYNAGINYAIPSNYLFNIEDISFLALFGHSDLAAAAGNSYNDYNVTISKKIKFLNIAAQWTSTDGRQKASPIDGSMITGVLTANF